MNDFPNQLFPFQRSHLVKTPILQICRTFVSLWGLLYSWWNANCLSNSFPWIPLIPMLQTWTFSISQNVIRRFLEISSKIVFVFSALDHSIWTQKDNAVSSDELLWPCSSPTADNGCLRSIMSFFFFQNNVLGLLMRNLIGTRVSLPKKRQWVSPFYHPSIHQLSTLEKTKLCHRPTLSCVLGTSFQQNCLWWCTGSWHASRLTTGCPVRSFFSAFALRVLWLSKLFFPGLSDAEDDRVESLASTSLWLFLHLILVAFFLTSLQNKL